MKIYCKVVRAFCLILLPLLFSACETRGSSVYWSDEPDYKNDGKSFSLSVIREEKVTAHEILDWEGGSRRVSEKKDAWQAQWQLDMLSEGATNYPAKIAYQGHYEAYYEKGKQGPVREIGSDGFSGPHPEYSDLAMRMSGGQGQDEDAYLAVSRSGRYMFKRFPAPGVYSVDTGTLVKPVPSAEKFREFMKPLEGLEMFTRALTGDLRYLVLVPYFGGDRSIQQGFNHDKAFCYDLETGAAFIKTFRLFSKTTSIAAAESTGGKLEFLAYADQKRLSVTDADGGVIAEIAENKARYFNFGSNSYWDQGGKVLFISDTEIEIFKRQRAVVLYRHDYASGKTRVYNLNTGEMPG